MKTKFFQRPAFVAALVLLLGALAWLPAAVAWFTTEELILFYMVKDNPLGMWSGLDALPGFFRPVIAITAWAWYNLFGAEPRPFHLLSIGLHLANSWFVLQIARQWCRFLPEEHPLRSRAFPWIAATWFWLWPSHSEPVAWIPAQTDVISAFFALAALAVYLRWRNGGRAWHAVAAGVLYALALSSKESVMAMPGVVACYEISRWWALRRITPVTVTGPLVAGAVLVGYMTVRFKLLGAFIGGYSTQFHTNFGWERLQWALSPNLMNAFFPAPFGRGDIMSRNALVIAVFVLCSIACVVLWRKQRGHSPLVIATLALAALVAFIPAINLGPNHITEGQRFAYLASAFGVMTMAAVLCYVVRGARVRALVAAVVAVASAGLLASYNTNWYHAGKVTREIVRGLKKLPESRRLYLLTTTDSYKEAFIARHALDQTYALLSKHQRVGEFVVASAVKYWQPDVEVRVSPNVAGGANYTVSLEKQDDDATAARTADVTRPALEAYGTVIFGETRFRATKDGDVVHVELLGYDPAQDTVAYLDGGEWVVLPKP